MNKRKDLIDVAKGVGIFLMVLGHANPSELLKLWIYGFHMPFFFFIAGYLFDTEKWKDRGLITLVKTRAKSYLIPYCIFFFINLICELVFYIMRFKGGGSINKILKEYIVAGLYSHDTNMPNCAPLWFLTCLFMTYILFWNLVINSKKIKKLIWSIVYLIILGIICNIEKAVGITQLPWHVDVALIASVFMLIGNEFQKLHLELEKLSICPKKLMMILLFGSSTVIIFINKRVIMVINQYQNMFLFILGAILMSAFILFLINILYKTHNGIIEKCFNIIGFWGRNTLIFIGFNYLINSFTYYLFKVVGMENPIVYCIINTITVMIVCSLIIILWGKIKEQIQIYK